MGYKIGVDIGGTFTDGVMIDPETGKLYTAKRPSTPSDLSVGFKETVERLLNKAPKGAIDYIAHGTTIACNAIIEHKTADVALVTTKGFRDVLEIARTSRKDLYDLLQDKPIPLVPRKWRYELDERIDKNGHILKPVRRSEVIKLISNLRRQNLKNVAICFLNSYVNPSNERECKRIIEEEYPEATVSISSEILPEFREYERTSTTVVNSALMPLMAEYLDRLEKFSKEIAPLCRLYIMQCNGGLSSRQQTVQTVYKTINSGPAAGVLMSKYLGDLTNHKNMICGDMGGTSFDISVITNGSILTKTEDKVYGHTIRGLFLDVPSIGAGGGSIALVDSAGLLRVGPESAGASPGPVCYGCGGLLPTVTDANLVLGRLDEEFFAGGGFRLDVELAKKQINEKIAKPLGLDIMKAANGIIEIVNSNIFQAIRLNTIAKGIDPRDYALLAYGGAGPMHIPFIAHDLGCRYTIIPSSPGIFSAAGLLYAGIRYDFTQTKTLALEDGDISQMEGVFLDLEQRLKKTVEQDRITEGSIQVEKLADMRYVGQTHELPIAVPHKSLSQVDIPLLRVSFDQKFESTFGFALKADPVEIISLRLVVTSSTDKPELRTIEEMGPSEVLRYEKLKPVFFGPLGGFIECPVYYREKLKAGSEIKGPAIIGQMDSTTIVPPDDVANVDRFGNIIIERRADN